MTGASDRDPSDTRTMSGAQNHMGRGPATLSRVVCGLAGIETRAGHPRVKNQGLESKGPI